MPLQATSGAASYDAFGGGVAAVPNYIEDVFSTWLYNGDTGGYIFASSGVSIVSGGMMWVKSRGSATNNYIFSPSLTNANYYLNTNTTAAQSNSGVTNNNFEAVDNGGGMRFGGAYSGISSSATGPFASWTFRKQPKFFDVVTYTGTGGSLSVNHNLGSTPGCIIVKRINSTSDWFVYHQDVNYDGSYLKLNSTDANNSGSVPPYFLINVTDTYFSMQSTGVANVSGATYVAYVFAHNAGGFGLTGTDNVISCGSYTGSSGIKYVDLGFEPQWILRKTATAAGNWQIYDNMRPFASNNGSAPNATLFPNTSGAESTAFSDGYIFPTATGFADGNSSSSNTYIYIAIRRGPMKVPTSGTSVFSPLYFTGDDSTSRQLTSGFPVDTFLGKRTVGDTSPFVDRLRGKDLQLYTSLTNAEGAGTNYCRFDSSVGPIVGYNASGININSSAYNYRTYSFRRAPSFFDQVCYTGTGVARTLNHNLGAVPELMIVKRRDGTSYGDWLVYHASLGNTKYLLLNTSDASATANSGAWNFTNPTSTQFTVGDWESLNTTATYVAYLFATCAGVSKVFSYTGNGSSQTINCGFTSGARFVLIKRTDSTGNWYVWDTARGIVSGNDAYFELNLSDAEVTSNDTIDTNSTGFVVNQVSATNVNVSSATYIGIAIA